MEKKLSAAAKTLNPSPIQELSYLAQRCNAINLAEGFPDFPAPSHVKNAAVSAILSDFNQYRLVPFIQSISKICTVSFSCDTEGEFSGFSFRYLLFLFSVSQQSICCLSYSC